MKWIRRPRADAPPRPTATGHGIMAAPDFRATADDILACFRLLLGRGPGEEERAGHMAQVGQPLADVVGGYLGSQEFKIRRLASADTGDWILATTAPGFSLYVSPADAAVGGLIAASGSYEPNVTSVFEAHLRPGMNVVDIGANIGWFTMLAASRVGPTGHVLAVEPNPLNARMVEASRQANGFGHVSLLPVAAGLRNGAAALHRTYSNASTTTLDRVEILAAEVVPMIRLDDVMSDDHRPVGIVKVDVEGAEAIALGGLEATLRRDRPVIVSEFSPSMMSGVSTMSARDYVAWLQGLGYRLGVIRMDGTVQPCVSADDAIDAHLASGVDHIDLIAERK